MRTSTRISPRLGRLAGAVAILFVPMAVLSAVLLARVADLGGAAGTLGLTLDVQTAARLAVAAGLAVAGAVVAGTLLHRR